MNIKIPSVQTTVILPAPDARWEVWRCSAGAGAVWKGSADDPSTAVNGSRSIVLGLPARVCRTFGFSAPTEDRQILRKLAFAQVEKRGLTRVGAEQTPFACHVLAQGGGKSLVSVDVVMPDASAALQSIPAQALAPNARFYSFPRGKLVLLEEQGRLVLCASRKGRLLHSQIVAIGRDRNGHVGEEMRIVTLALRQQGILPKITGMELWGDFSAEELHQYAAQLGLPVEAKPRPAPDPVTLRREASAQLLSPMARQAVRRRQLLQLRWVAAAFLILPLLAWAFLAHHKLVRLESEAARMEAALNIPGNSHGGGPEQERIRAENELVSSAQARWNALRMAVEPRRYPVAHLDGLSRCLTASDVMLTRFESKLSDVTVNGAARSARDAYTYFNAINKDGPLSVYAWSMVQPTIAADGAVAFEIKGKMR